MRACVVVRTAVRPDAGRDRGRDAAPGRSAAPLGRLCRTLSLLVVLCLTACGLPGDDSVARIAVPPGPTATERTAPPPDGGAVLVWFVRGARLEAVPRQADEAGPAGALELLLAGPTSAEVVDGLRTALSPVDLTVPPGPAPTGTVTIAVGRDFADIGGGNQLLAVAQVVWTATQFRTVDLVCFTLDGTVIEVPTDAGLIDRPVGRYDYPSVAPRPARRPSTSPPRSPTAGCPLPESSGPGPGVD